MSERKPPMTLEQWKEKITAGGFATAGFFRRALSHANITKAEKKTAMAIADDYFTKNPAPVRNSNGGKSAKTTPKKQSRRKGAFTAGTNGIGSDGEGDCLAVTMCVIAHDSKMRDSVNRLLSQAREEGDITLPVLSSRFARICKIASRADDR